MKLTKSDILEKITNGEDSYTQFKRKLNSASDLAKEICAFANAQGGNILIGIDEVKSGGKLLENKVVGISAEDVQNLNGWVSAMTDHLIPCPEIYTQVLSWEDVRILNITIPEGETKSYRCKKGLLCFIRSGADKREMSTEEITRRTMEQAPPPHIEEREVPRTNQDELNSVLLMEFIEKKFGQPLSPFLKERQLSKEKLLQNMNMMADNQTLTIAGTMLYANSPEIFLPTFHIKAVSYYGTDIADIDYMARETIGGNLTVQYRNSIAFLKMNLSKRQAEEGFNTQGTLEIAETALEEHLTNALVHRSYAIQTAIRLFVFADRVEIISPGHLPNHQTVDALKAGAANAIPRNPIMVTHAAYLLPYSGIGSGILRALKAHPNTDFVNDPVNEQFKVILHRPQNK